jgi:hypothetical protein
VVARSLHNGEDMNAKRNARPFHGHNRQTCYCCDAVPVGFADRTHDAERGFVLACARHADSTIATYDACIYCNGPVRKGGLDIDGDFAHVKCHKAECAT